MFENIIEGIAAENEWIFCHILQLNFARESCSLQALTLAPSIAETLIEVGSWNMCRKR